MGVEEYERKYIQIQRDSSFSQYVVLFHLKRKVYKEKEGISVTLCLDSPLHSNSTWSIHKNYVRKLIVVFKHLKEMHIVWHILTWKQEILKIKPTMQICFSIDTSQLRGFIKAIVYALQLLVPVANWKALKKTYWEIN